MDPRSEVLLRQAELFQGNLLLVGLPADDLLVACPTPTAGAGMPVTRRRSMRASPNAASLA